ncbi:hypothetical protein RRG08_042033 [Elysia crispata]|uniref:C-type lectin domain-containing protein n=1 Tax=Elysia crispata TaxID=231223 RepID=A0AAE0Z8C7_9GAST|nr:hypothetical protein RRG08_042033 [Elysia crispata]
MEKTVVLFVLSGLQAISGQGIFDPCYFWSGSVYAGDGMCFKLIDEFKNFNDSQKICQNDGAILAELRTHQQMDTAKFLISGQRTVWLGGVDPAGGSNFVWLSDLQDVTLSVTNSLYQVRKPPICLTMTPASELQPNSCNAYLRSICQIYAGNPCDVFLSGGEYYNSSCFLPVDKPMTLQEGMLHCKRLNANVVEPSTQSIIEYMKQFAKRNYSPSSEIWLGLTPHNNTMKWQSTGEIVSTTNWVNGEIETSEFSVDSAVVMNGSSDWSWELVSQSTSAHVVCQRDLTGECGGVFSSGRCFSMYDDTSNWNIAKAACQERGSYLAEPKTEILGRTIKKYIQDKTLITYVLLGATDLETEGTFVWDYSRQFLRDTYTDWAPSQPDDISGSERYLEFFVEINGWNDMSLRTSSVDRPHFLCERVVPIYIHFYVIALPKDDWEVPALDTTAMIIISSNTKQQGYNYVEFSKFPFEEVQTTSLLKKETYQYSVKIHELRNSGLKQKYIRVKSTDYLDVHFFLISGGFICSTLVLEEMIPGRSSAFFSSTGQLDTSLAIVSTEEKSSTLDLALLTDFETRTFFVDDMKIQSSNMLVVSTSLSEKYQSLYVEFISGSTFAQLGHSDGALSVFRFGRQSRNRSNDMSCDQILPISMIGSDYITFPSLPMNVDIIDHFTVVAVYSNTTITVHHQNPEVTPMKIYLRWPGDIFDLELPASNFFHVNGTSIFYLYARLTRSGGLCSLTLMHENLFRSSYQLSVVGPLKDMTAFFVVVIVRTQDKGAVKYRFKGNRYVPDECRDVLDTKWSGCFFQLKNLEHQSTVDFEMDTSEISQFGAYLFTTNNLTSNTICSQLGVRKKLQNSLEYDFNEFLSTLEPKDLCDKEATTTAPQAVVSDFTTSNARKEESTEIEDTNLSSDSSHSNEATDIVSIVDEDIMPSGTPPCKEIPLINTTFSKKEVEEIVEKLIVHLRVKAEDLSKVKRSKTSAPDDRVSSTTMGMGGIVFIAVVLGLVFVSDISKLLKDLRMAIRDVKKS